MNKQTIENQISMYIAQGNNNDTKKNLIDILNILNSYYLTDDILKRAKQLKEIDNLKRKIMLKGGKK